MLILIFKREEMEALQRDVLSNNWIALVFVTSLVLLFFLKLFRAEKLKGFSTSIFNKGFVKIESQEKHPAISFFHTVFTFFSFLMISISIYFIVNKLQQSDIFLFLDYLKVSSIIVIYMILRFVLEFLLMTLFEVKDTLLYFFLSKKSYLYSISIGLLIVNLIYFYSFQNQTFLITGFIALFLIRLLLILINNKNLIIKELFYFMLYLCAFEIAPLFVLFKLIF